MGKMTIETKPDDGLVPFSGVKVGQAFIFEGYVCLRIVDRAAGNNPIRAVNLSEHCAYAIFDGARVQPVDAKLTVGS